MATYFVTSTGTGSGKTLTTALLLLQLAAAKRPARAIKPVLSGFDPQSAAESDAGILLAAMGKRATQQSIAAIAPWRFAAPLSVDMASAREGRAVDFDALITWCRSQQRDDQLLIEGAGGVMAPIDERHVMRDWIAALDVPALLVTGSYLGTLSHTLTALVALRDKGIDVAAVIVAASPGSPVSVQETAEVIARHGQVDTRVVPRLAIGPDGLPDLVGTPDLSDLIA
jgi:dethiobiotin synthetase